MLNSLLYATSFSMFSGEMGGGGRTVERFWRVREINRTLVKQTNKQTTRTENQRHIYKKTSVKRALNSSSDSKRARVIVFKTFRFQNVYCPHKNEQHAFTNSSSLKSVFVKLRFCDGLVSTTDLTIVEIELCLQIHLVCRDGII